MKTGTFKYFTKKRNIAMFLAFVSIFALGFILIFKPFELSSWFTSASTDEYVLVVSLVVGIGFLVLLASRLLMYFLRKKIDLGLKLYMLWIAGEVIVISLFCSMFSWYYGKFTKEYFEILPNAFKYTFAILFIPYIISWLYLALMEKNKEAEPEKNILNSTISETELLLKEKKDIINFFDEKGQLRLSVSHENLFYIESADNYVNIYYSNKGKFTRFVLRSTLKSIEETFLDSDLVRCHRSYIINFNNVKVLRKEKDGLFLDLDFDGSPEIPVSKTYADSIVDLFSRHSVL